MSEPSPMKCVRCGKQSPPTTEWIPGWGCLFGSLAACSVGCARTWATKNSKYGCLPPGEYEECQADGTFKANE